MIGAKYTVVLKDLLDSPSMKQAIDKALSTYPLYEKKSKEEFIPSIIPTREQLNKKILDHYKYREIGFETPGRFIDELEIAMNEIMPYYNQIMFSLDQDYDIKFNVDYKRETNIKRDSKDNFSNEGSNQTSANDKNTTNASINNYNKHVNSQTPQNELSVGETDIDTLKYADNMSFNKDTNTENGETRGESSSNSVSGSSGNTNSEQNEQSTERILGNYGQVSIQSLISSYRDLITNVEQRIITDRRITELFMNVF